MLSSLNIKFEETDKDELILPKEHNDLFIIFSLLSFVTAIYAIKRGYYDLSLIPIGVGINSINYWRCPKKNGLRRNLDVTWIYIGALWQILRAVESSKSVEFYTTMFISIIIFIFGRHFYMKKEYELSTFFHILVHIGGNIANYILYSGTMPKFQDSWLIQILNRLKIT